MTDRGHTFSISNFSLNALAEFSNADDTLFDESFFLRMLSGSDSISGGTGNDWLFGGDGKDTLDGGSGSDTVDYSDKTEAVKVTLNNSKETTVYVRDVAKDTIKNIENIHGGLAADKLTGNSLANTLNGDSGNDTLDGGAGNDTLIGGAGHDTFIVDSALDAITEGLNSGTDTVRTALTSYSLAGWVNVENLTYTGAGASTLTGNALANTLRGGTGHDTLFGGAGSDIIFAGDGDDWLFGYEEYSDSQLSNQVLTDKLRAEKNNSVDKLYGGLGNDIYIFDYYLNTPEVIENENEGIDTILGDLPSYTLGNNVENYVNDRKFTPLTVTITGNNLNNIIKTSPAKWESANEILHTISSHAKPEAFYGMAGNDTLMGGAGDDHLDGGTGVDVMWGGAGSDVYYVDNPSDETNEAISATNSADANGTDLVYSSITRKLGNYLENLTLTGTAATNGTGNALANTITGNSAVNTLTGNAGNDTLDGGAGSDVMWGGAGNDVYYVDNASDQTNEAISASNTADATGTDWVYSSVNRMLGNYLENLTLRGTAAINGTGNGLANTITGNGAANTLSGGAGHDTLDGGLGNDTLTGGTGADYFDFTSVLHGIRNVDAIMDFDRANDFIRLDNAVMAGLGTTTGALTATAFVSGAGRKTAADAFDRVIYNTNTGDLYYDADGTGSSAAIKIAVLGTSTRPALDHTDFLIV